MAILGRVFPPVVDLKGTELLLDADADTTITADTDDQIDIKIAGADDFQFTANTFTAQSGSTIAAQALTATTGAFSSDVTVTGDLTVSGDDLTMGTNTSGAALIADGTNFNPVVISGDISINTSGVAAIGSGVIVAADIASNAVTTAKINADAVTGAKIADDAIDSEHYTDASIDTAHYAAGSVDTTALGADSVTAAKIGDDVIDSEHYAAGSIDTAHIADDQITLAKMASGTAGNIISFDASGDPVAIVTGSDGQVLTSAGAGQPPAFEAAAGGGGGEDAFTAESTPGTTPTATGTDAIAIGDGADSQDTQGLAIGVNSLVTDSYGIAIGSAAEVTKDYAIAIGSGAEADETSNIAIGKDSEASGNTGSIAIGLDASTDRDSSVAIGRLADVTGTGDYQIAIGYKSVAMGSDSIAIGGGNTTAAAAGGAAPGKARAIAIGSSASANGVDSVAIGNTATATDGGEFAFASGQFAADGDAMTSLYVLRNQTTDATQTELFADGSTADISVASDSTVFFRASIVARRTDADNESAAYIIEGCIDNNAGTTALVGGLGTKTIIAEDTSAWDVTITADNTNDGINILVTGEASKTIRWVARVETTTVAG